MISRRLEKFSSFVCFFFGTNVLVEIDGRLKS